MNAENAPTLPGLEVMTSSTPGSTPMTDAVVITLDDLREQGLLKPMHVATARLALTLAEVLDDPRRAGRASGVAQAASVLADILANKLPQPKETTAATKFADFVGKLEAAAAAGREVDDAVSRA